MKCMCSMKSKPADFYHAEHHRNLKLRQRMQSKLSKLDTVFKLKMKLLNKCIKKEYDDSCYELWCEIDDISNVIDEMHNEIKK